jgi:predicted acyltransferase
MARVTTVPAPLASTRLISLDVFRGITMAAMVVVNNPGDWGNVYGPLLHAEWHGWTPTDMIFPFFLFIVGVSITLSARSASVGSILKRAAIIFGVGLFLAGFPWFPLTTWRIPGVLQRIAVCYAAAALLWRWSASRRRVPWLAGTAAALMLVYWGLITLIPVPGGSAGDLTPGNDLGAYIDRALMGGHLWKPTWDPEGLLSTIPSVATTLLGVLAGMWMRSDVAPVRRAGGLAAAGVAGILVGLIWDLAFPINKNLWTSSYVMFMAGAAALFLAACYWVIDVKGWRAWAKPFVILGVNALALYALSGLLVRAMSEIRFTLDDGTRMSSSRLLYVTVFEPYFAPKNASLLYALSHLALMFLILLWMYRRRIFIRA